MLKLTAQLSHCQMCENFPCFLIILKIVTTSIAVIAIKNCHALHKVLFISSKHSCEYTAIVGTCANNLIRRSLHFNKKKQKQVEVRRSGNKMKCECSYVQ